MPDIDDLIDFANAQQPTKFATTFDDLMKEKAAAALEDMKVSIAQAMYGSEDSSEDEDETEDDDDDIDDDDDLDFDLDDEDLTFDDDDDEDEDDDWDSEEDSEEAE